MGYERLEKNLIDIIKEEQAKLGFFEEDIRLYYPLSSLNHFFDSQDNEASMLNKLKKLPASITDKLGNIEVTAKNERFCIHVPPKGTLYVHDTTGENEFIRELVSLLANHGTSMKQVQALFEKQPYKLIREEMNNGEFDLMLRFENNPDDTYYYCFHDEGCHIIYHRFLPEDYADFDF